MPETWPRIQRFGSGFGQEASTWNCGTLRSCALACENKPATAAASSKAVLVLTNAEDMVPLLRQRITQKLTQTFPAQGIVLASPSAAVHLHPNPRGIEDEHETHQRSSYRCHGRLCNGGLGSRRGRRSGRRRERRREQLGLEL